MVVAIRADLAQVTSENISQAQKEMNDNYPESNILYKELPYNIHEFIDFMYRPADPKVMKRALDEFAMVRKKTFVATPEYNMNKKEDTSDDFEENDDYNANYSDKKDDLSWEPIFVPLLGTGLLSEQEGLGHSSHAGPVRIGNFTHTIELLRRVEVEGLHGHISCIKVAIMKMIKMTHDDYVTFIIIIIISAVGRPLLDIGLPHRPPVASVGSGLHPPYTCGFNQVIRPSCWWTSYAALADPRPPLEKFSAPTAIRSPCYMARPLPLQRADSLGLDVTLQRYNA
ncbi:hypothetical protein MSG28_015921 [Choristoneura fumiferana]|uniref:Uncharacterized protein n=1 Tax=Choristoneura fumiferana TaxID=7141 RepID=A0ACC0K4N4_CHOFU|nr:hypothetical protein MSG28_015921 [Choristoneura fumiferana]